MPLPQDLPSVQDLESKIAKINTKLESATREREEVEKKAAFQPDVEYLEKHYRMIREWLDEKEKLKEQLIDVVVEDARKMRERERRSSSHLALEVYSIQDFRVLRSLVDMANL